MWEIWSFGAVPWAEYLQSGVAGLLLQLKSGAVLDRPVHVSEDLYVLMRRCWSLNPEDRPEFQELVDELDAIYIVIPHLMKAGQEGNYNGHNLTI